MSLAINKNVLRNLIEVHEAEADDQREVLEEGDYILEKGRMSAPLNESVFEKEQRLEKLLHRKSSEGRFFDISTDNDGLTGTLFYSYVQGIAKHKSLLGARDLTTGEDLRMTPVNKPESVIAELNKLLLMLREERCGGDGGIVPGDTCEKSAAYELQKLYASAQEYVAASREFNQVLVQMNGEFVAGGFVFEHTVRTYRELVAKLDVLEALFARVEL